VYDTIMQEHWHGLRFQRRVEVDFLAMYG